MKRHLIACFLALALLLLGWPGLSAHAQEEPYIYTVETEPAAENLTGRCAVSSDLKTKAYAWRVTDGELSTKQKFTAGQRREMRAFVSCMA